MAAGSTTKNALNRVPPLQLAFLFILAFASLSLFPRVRFNPALVWIFWGITGGLLFFLFVLRAYVVRAGRVLRYEFIPHKAHYIQFAMQGLIYLYWGMYWREVYPFLPLLAAQILFVYALDMLISWSRQDDWILGFGPLPIVLSANLFIWFKDDWFFLQFVFISIGVLGKQFLRWHREGRLTHIFNPSAFSAFVISVGLLATGTSSLTWGEQLATTLSRPPHMYLEIFLLGLIVQALFSVTLVTVAAGGMLVALNLAYTHWTGVYHTIDSGIPVAVFIGLHLLVTDPATSPRRTVGKILFGVMYGAGVFGLYSALRWYDAPTFYDKLLCIPILNLMVPSLDRLSDRLAARVRLLNTDWAFNPQRYNLVHMGVWTALFCSILFTGFLAKGKDHPGGSIAFWEQACQEGRWNACKTWVHTLQITCQFNFADACLEAGTLLNEGRIVPRNAALAGVRFGHACDLGSPEGCERLVAHVKADGLEALQQACDRGEGASCFTLGAMYRAGLGFPMDPTRAFLLFNQSCANDWPNGCIRLAQSYRYGQGTPIDFAKAIVNFEKACRNRAASSCAEVADIYSSGIGGVKKDEALAAQRLQEACNLGLQSACNP